MWGLDDYQFLAFLLGAGQLVNHDSWTPDIIFSSECQADVDEYVYFGCIEFIRSVKKGVPFGEGSPTLNDISAVPNWGKVASGLVKMYQAEVLCKFPVI